MATPRESMDAELKAAVVPALRLVGFKGSYPHFRRLSGPYVDLLTFQFDKWGGGFVLEITRASAAGFTTHWGMLIPASKLTALDLHPDSRRRIQPREGSDTEAWFRYDNRPVADVSKQVLDVLPDAEAWWASRVEV
ncbi:DUF4304 domain-containing protein [Ramlibacter sp. XY19]|uniref:DUF4304 domain-containing protein n=1 Tax=Ramlibacter paludis TaxID=2908000 RepID=UPI0023DA082E|nr:DUF4304 domain-containing protein [Ramlibacter paludis]MCG2591159.1 DUF4304 domain-containing protein [Ramlibacter paludis]